MDKKFKKALVFTFAIVVLSLILTLPGYAAWGNPNQGPRHGGRGDIMKTLNLAPEQKAQIEKQRSASRQAWSELRDKLRTKRLELKQELEKPNIDRNRINTIIAEIKNLTGEQLELRVNNILAMKQVLTPEQFKKIQERKEKIDTGNFRHKQ